MSEEQTALQLCTFRVGELYLGINVLDVQEVLHSAEVTAVPNAERSIKGLINLRGQIATAIDLRSRLGLAERDESERPTHIVIHDGGESVSFLIDAIGDVLDVDPDLYEPPPETMTGVARELILGAYKLESELLLILDIRGAVTVPRESSEGALV